LDRFLTTEELLLAISSNYHEQAVDTKANKGKNKIRKILNKYVIYWSIVFIAVLHLVFAAIPMLFNDKGLGLLGYRYAITYQFNEETAPEYPLFIAVHHPFALERIQEDTLILIRGRFGTEYYNIEEIISIDENNKELTSTFDGTTTSTYSFDEIEAIFYRRANQFETLYFIFGTPRGFIMLFIGNLVLFGGLYLMYINPKPLLPKKSKKVVKNEQEEA
jgi:hypothetical protein